MTLYISLKKILNKLTLVSIIFFVVFFTWPVIAFPQQRNTGQDQLLTLPPATIRLDSLSSILAHKTGFVLSFNAGEINPGTKMTFLDTKVKLDTLLSYLHQHYQLTHKMIGNHIILFKDSSSDKKEQITAKTYKSRLPQGKPNIAVKEEAAVVHLKKEIKLLPITALPNTKTGTLFRSPSPSLPKEVGNILIKQNRIPLINSGKSSSYPERKLILASDKSDAAEKPKKISNARLSKGSDGFYAAAGLTTSDVLYMNPQIKIGLPWLFASASWETNFKASGFFYGLGTSVKLSDHWDIQLSASSGTLAKDFRWPTPTSDTIGRMKTRLARIDILGKIHLSKRLVLQFGPILNFMKSKYSLRDSSIANSFPPSGDVSKDIFILNPPYTLSNSYKKKTGTNKKMWVGIQIGIFYTLW